MIISIPFLIPSGFDGITGWPFINVRNLNDHGLIAHEMVHYKRMAWWTPIWWLLYVLIPSFRIKEEVLAYKESIRLGMAKERAANWLIKYDDITYEEALRKLST